MITSKIDEFKEVKDEDDKKSYFLLDKHLSDLMKDDKPIHKDEDLFMWYTKNKRIV
jgi:thermostable 8-oxoguanine DNA glycosylase